MKRHGAVFVDESGARPSRRRSRRRAQAIGNVHITTIKRRPQADSRARMCLANRGTVHWTLARLGPLVAVSRNPTTAAREPRKAEGA